MQQELGAGQPWLRAGDDGCLGQLAATEKGNMHCSAPVCPVSAPCLPRVCPVSAPSLPRLCPIL